MTKNDGDRHKSLSLSVYIYIYIYMYIYIFEDISGGRGDLDPILARIACLVTPSSRIPVFMCLPKQGRPLKIDLKAKNVIK